MKHGVLFLMFALLVNFCFSQIPESFKYQAIVRDNSGAILKNKNVSLKISILENSASGNVVYTETHLVNSNNFGLINLNIGSGNVLSGTFSSINWGTSNKFLKIEIDINGGNNYIFMGTSQLLSVPYALYAKNGIIKSNTVQCNLGNEGVVRYNYSSNTLEYCDGTKWIAVCGSKSFSCGSVLTDPRDGQVYPTIKIGNQCWMAKNLNIGQRINGSVDQTNNNNIEKYCYNDNESFCNIYGGLYQWNELMNYTEIEKTEGICPSGWHIPSVNEFNVLLNNYPSSTVGNELVFGGSSGFDALMAGYRYYNGTFKNFNANTYYFSSSKTDATHSSTLNISGSIYINTSANPSAFIGPYGFHFSGASVRCIKDQ